MCTCAKAMAAKPTCLEGVAQALRGLNRVDLSPAAHQTAKFNRNRVSHSQQ